MAHLISGVPRSQVEEMRRSAGNLADWHPDVYGAIFIGHAMSVLGSPAEPLYGDYENAIEVNRDRLPAPPGRKQKAIVSYEGGRYGPGHISVVFYGDERGFRSYLRLAEMMADSGIAFGGAGRILTHDRWQAGPMLLAHLMVTADHHKDGMTIYTDEGTIDHPGWSGPCKYHSLRYDVLKSTCLMLAGVLAQQGDDPSPRPAASKPISSGTARPKRGMDTPGSKVIAAAYGLAKERRPVSWKAACDRAGVCRKNAAKNYPEAVKLVESLSVPDRGPVRGGYDRRTGRPDGVDGDDND